MCLSPPSSNFCSLFDFEETKSFIIFLQTAPFKPSSHSYLSQMHRESSFSPSLFYTLFSSLLRKESLVRSVVLRNEELREEEEEYQQHAGFVFFFPAPWKNLFLLASSSQHPQFYPHFFLFFARAFCLIYIINNINHKARFELVHT